MKFYQACIHVAESVAALMTPQQIDAFIHTDDTLLADYQLSLGMWVRNHLLSHDTYLRDALTALALHTPVEMSLYLLQFTKQYLVLKRENLI